MKNDRELRLFSALTREIVSSNLIVVGFMGFDLQKFSCSAVGTGFKPVPTCVRPLPCTIQNVFVCFPFGRYKQTGSNEHPYLKSGEQAL